MFKFLNIIGTDVVDNRWQDLDVQNLLKLKTMIVYIS